MPLRQIGVLNSDLLKRLAVLSVTTAEEFIGLVLADESGVAGYLELPMQTLSELEHKVLAALPPDTAKQLAEQSSEPFPLGALPPDYAKEG